jgi:hypothetical protein
MHKRTTYSILAVAFGAAAATVTACGEPAPAPTAAEAPKPAQTLAEELEDTPLVQALENRQHFAPLCDDAGFPLPGNVNSKQGPTKLQQFCGALATPPAPSSAGQSPPGATCDFENLNRELSQNFILPDALAQSARFRCLCDEQGYPLVGNINAKGTTASAFCAALRERGLP